MIYRVLVDYRLYQWPADGRVLVLTPGELGYPEDDRLLGASFGHMCYVMRERGLKEPEITNPRARFFFTEAGWQRVGRYVAAEARQDGHVVRVLRQKNPDPSRIIYQDELQLAILPGRRDGSRKGTSQKQSALGVNFTIR